MRSQADEPAGATNLQMLLTSMLHVFRREMQYQHTKSWVAVAAARMSQD